MKNNLIITIGRQFGSGGREIGKILSEMLNLKYYDKELILEASKASGLCAEHFERADEKAPNRFFNALSKGWLSGASGMPTSGGWSDEMVFKFQADVIREIAERESAVIVGRCADYILRDHPRCVNVFVVADKEDRIRRICEADSCDRSAAEKKIENGDRQRAEYYNFYSTGRWGAADTYHLCINSSTMGIEATAEFIKNFIRKKLGL